MKKSILKFSNYTVTKLHYEACQCKDLPDTIRIEPKFERDIKKIDEQHYDAILNFSINADGTQNAPFSIDISMIGHFVLDCENPEDESAQGLVNQNTFAILFPYLRAMVTSLTSCANIPPMVLPVINMANLK